MITESPRSEEYKGIDEITHCKVRKKFPCRLGNGMMSNQDVDAIVLFRFSRSGFDLFYLNQAASDRCVALGRDQSCVVFKRFPQRICRERKRRTLRWLLPSFERKRIELAYYNLLFCSIAGS
jgi:hypothetical protein